MTKIKPTSWMIFWNEPLFEGDEDNYTASYEWRDENGKHEVTDNFKSYAQAYGWLAERIIL